MNDVSRALLALALPCALAACATPVANDTPPPALPAAPAATGPALAPRAFATVTGATSTQQGGALEGFAYAEKPGDAALGAVTFADGAARVTGFTGAGKGSGWAGIGVMVQGAPNGGISDLSGYRTLRITLAAATPTALRIRLVGADATAIASGCYPVAVQNVGPELRAYEVSLASFAPEGYCGAQGKAAAATLPGIAAIEVSAPTTDTAKRRDIDFRVGPIAVVR